MSDHAKFSPSSMARLMQCPGSHALSLLYPKQQSDAADEGTLAHKVAAQALLKSPFDSSADEDMLRFAEEYRQSVQPDSTTHIEEKVDCSAIHADCWGTPDAYKIKREIKLIMLWDYKYGFKPVEISENWQLITYALGIKTWLGLSDDWCFQLAIFQPRAHHRNGVYRVITITGAELMAYLPQIQGQIEAALQPDAPCIVGTACQHCTAAHACEALAMSTASIFDWLHYSAIPWNLEPAFESAELNILNDAESLIKARKRAIEQSIIGGLKAGKQGYSHMIEQGQGREAWSCDTAQVKALGAIFGVDLVKEVPITPKQAIAKKIPADVVRVITVVPQREYKLVSLNKIF